MTFVVTRCVIYVINILLLYLQLVLTYVDKSTKTNHYIINSNIVSFLTMFLFLFFFTIIDRNVGSRYAHSTRRINQFHNW